MMEKGKEKKRTKKKGGRSEVFILVKREKKEKRLIEY